MRQFLIQSLQPLVEIGGNVQQKLQETAEANSEHGKSKKDYLIQWPESPGPWLPP